MSARFTHRSGHAPTAPHGCEDAQLGYVNPWAECWGSPYPIGSGPGQMCAGGEEGKQMEASQMGASRMEASQVELCGGALAGGGALRRG